MRNTYKVLVGKPKGIRPLRSPESRCEGNVKMYFKETWREGMDWIHLAQDGVQCDCVIME